MEVLNIQMFGQQLMLQPNLIPNSERGERTLRAVRRRRGDAIAQCIDGDHEVVVGIDNAIRAEIVIGGQPLGVTVEPSRHEHNVAEIRRQSTVGAKGQPAGLDDLTILENTIPHVCRVERAFMRLGQPVINGHRARERTDRQPHRGEHATQCGTDQIVTTTHPRTLPSSMISWAFAI